MLPVLVGLAGVVIGWLLKTVTDLLAERRAQNRADETWRREHYVDAVGVLVHAGRELMAANSSLSRAIYSLSNAERGGNPSIIESCRAEHRDAVDRQHPWTTSTIQALEAVRLYAPANIVERADTSWEALNNGGQLPDVTTIDTFEKAVTAALAALRADTRATAGLQ